MSVLFKGRGYVVKWKLKSGYGFVKLTHIQDEETEVFYDDPEMKDVFVHNEDIENMQGFRSLIEGQIIEFDVIKNGEKPDGSPKYVAQKVNVIKTPMNIVEGNSGNH